MRNFENTLAIGPEFFAKARNDYARYEWALVREFLQNSIDCGSKAIRVDVRTVDSVTVLVVENDGDPMSHEVLVGKLLSLGSSGKDFKAGSVGGFGKAKELLYFCHENYKIESGNFRVVGRGAGYNIDDAVECGNDTHLHGTRSTITMTENVTDRLLAALREFARFAQWGGTLTVNGEVLACDMRKGSPRREFEWGTVYTNQSASHKLVTRVNGVPMFTDYTSYEGCVVIELKGESAKTLTSNRDSLVWKYRDEYGQFLASLTSDKSKALRTRTPSYVKFEGSRYKHKRTAEQTEADTRAFLDVVRKALASVPGGEGAIAAAMSARSMSAGAVEIQSVREEVQNVLMQEFIVKNETEMVVPDCYLPASEQFGHYSQRLARTWGNLLLELHKMLDLESTFAIGFVISADSIAQHEKSSEFGTVYYVNPAEVVKQQSSESKSLRRRWKLTDRGALLATAIHEVVHGMGFSAHDESYAAMLTEVMGQVFQQRQRFNWCFTD